MELMGTEGIIAKSSKFSDSLYFIKSFLIFFPFNLLACVPYIIGLHHSTLI